MTIAVLIGGGAEPLTVPSGTEGGVQRGSPPSGKVRRVRRWHLFERERKKCHTLYMAETNCLPYGGDRGEPPAGVHRLPYDAQHR